MSYQMVLQNQPSGINIPPYQVPEDHLVNPLDEVALLQIFPGATIDSEVPTGFLAEPSPDEVKRYDEIRLPAPWPPLAMNCQVLVARMKSGGAAAKVVVGTDGYPDWKIPVVVVQPPVHVPPPPNQPPLFNDPTTGLPSAGAHTIDDVLNELAEIDKDIMAIRAKVGA